MRELNIVKSVQRGTCKTVCSQDPLPMGLDLGACQDEQVSYFVPISLKILALRMDSLTNFVKLRSEDNKLASSKRYVPIIPFNSRIFYDIPSPGSHYSGHP